MRTFRRTRTNTSMKSESEARRRHTLPQESTGKPVQDRYPAYENFPWEKVEEYLKTRWPTWTNYNAQHVSRAVFNLCLPYVY